jgi:hypothetical protein
MVVINAHRNYAVLKNDPVRMLPAYAGHAKFMLKHINAKVGKEGRYRLFGLLSFFPKRDTIAPVM